MYFHNDFELANTKYLRAKVVQNHLKHYLRDIYVILTWNFYSEEPGVNGTKKWLHTFQISRTGVSPPDVVYHHTQGTHT